MNSFACHMLSLLLKFFNSFWLYQQHGSPDQYQGGKLFLCFILSKLNVLFHVEDLEKVS